MNKIKRSLRRARSIAKAENRRRLVVSIVTGISYYNNPHTTGSQLIVQCEDGKSRPRVSAWHERPHSCLSVPAFLPEWNRDKKLAIANKKAYKRTAIRMNDYEEV